jgi:DNA-binding phage protein
MKVKISKWNIYEDFDTEEEIQAFVECSIDEAKNDTDPSILAHCLETAVKAREYLAAKKGISAEAGRTSDEDKNPLTAFDKAARSFGYRVVLAPV